METIRQNISSTTSKQTCETNQVSNLSLKSTVIIYIYISSYCLRVLPLCVYVYGLFVMDSNGGNITSTGSQMPQLQNYYLLRRLLRALLLFTLVALTCITFYQSSTSPIQLFTRSISSFSFCHAKTCTTPVSNSNTFNFFI